MSIASEIERLQGVKSDILQAIADKGVEVPSGSMLADCPGLIASISGGGGGDNVIGGREYRTVIIDGVEWLAENLDYKFCNIGGDGSPSTPNAWYCNNDESTYGIDGTRKCGLLYNWYAVKLLNDNRSDLIPGWHVPTTEEWDELATAVGDTDVTGTRLKATDVSWATYWGGTDDYGFGVLPAGLYSGSFVNVGYHAAFWTSTEASSSAAYNKYFDTGSSMSSYNFTKYLGISVRLVKDS